MKIEITQEDIDLGERKNCQKDAAARALCRAACASYHEIDLVDAMFMNTQMMHLEDDECDCCGHVTKQDRHCFMRAKTPSDLCRFMAASDAGAPLEPATFEVMFKCDGCGRAL